MIPLEKHKIRISDKELDDPQAKIDLLKLTGPNTYKKVVAQFAKQRLPVENPGGFSDAELKKLSDEEYEKNMDKIHADLDKQADPKKPVYAEVEISETQLASAAAKEMFVQRFGYDRLMQALGLEGLEELEPKAYHQILDREYKPYKATSGAGSSSSVGKLG